MANPSPAYEPKHVSGSVLYRIVLEHFETFRAQAASLRDGEGLPRFVEQEFRDFLRCGCLAAGFARFRCRRCGFDRLVPFSCKGRGFCPSCGGRRMAERAAHLVDAVLPDVAVRQWVLTLPHRIRYLLAWDHDLCRAVVGVSVRAVLGFLRRRARRGGAAGGRSGAVVVVQRFGGALNLNVHLHALVLDGVCARDETGAMRFHRTPPIAGDDVGGVLERLAVLTPRPRVNLILYRGVLAPRAAWRAEVVAYRAADGAAEAGGTTVESAAPNRGRPGGWEWAELMRRAFGFDVLACPRCGGRLRLIALIQQQEVVRRILRHLGLPSDLPVPGPARGRRRCRAPDAGSAADGGFTPGC